VNNTSQFVLLNFRARSGVQSVEIDGWVELILLILITPPRKSTQEHIRQEACALNIKQMQNDKAKDTNR
jgi:hypothetical protein